MDFAKHFSASVCYTAALLLGFGALFWLTCTMSLAIEIVKLLALHKLSMDTYLALGILDIGFFAFAFGFVRSTLRVIKYRHAMTDKVLHALNA